MKKNPLRNVAKLNELQQQLESTQRELHAVLTEIKGLPNQAKADRAAIDIARKKDEQFLRDTLNVAQLDGAELSRYEAPGARTIEAPKPEPTRGRMEGVPVAFRASRTGP